MKRALVLCLLAASCAKSPEAAARGPVVASRIAALEAELAAEPPVESEAPEDPGDIGERVRAVLGGLAYERGRMHDALLADLAQLGDAALPELVAASSDELVSADERLAAFAGIAAVDTPRAAELLLGELEGSTDRTRRAHAAWNLGKTSQDWVVPRVLLRLKYETDYETVVFIADALVHFGNYAGIDAALTVAASGDPQVRSTAAAYLAQWATDAGLADDVELWRAWHDGDPDERLPMRTPSPRHRLEVWRRIAELSGEHFQLRGVDDARFVLSRGAAWVADLLVEALGDEDVYTRVHAAQCLERMGPRGIAAGPALVRALDDAALAPQAAAAIGGVCYRDAAKALTALLGRDHPQDLRVACARALGRLDVPAVRADLLPLVSVDEPADLRLAAAESLVELGFGDEVLAFLLDAMESDAFDRGAAEDAVERWLTRDADSAELLEAWKALEGPPGIPPTPEEQEARLAARAKLVRERMAAR